MALPLLLIWVARTDLSAEITPCYDGCDQPPLPPNIALIEWTAYFHVIDFECTMSIMRVEPPPEFDWDSANLRHLANHGITRSEFEQAMVHDPIIIDFADETGEERWCALGATDRLRVLFLVFAYRQERIRPITGWDAGKRLHDLYFRKKGE